jgi:hypothetical protein
MIISLDQNVVSFLEGSSKVALAWSKIKALLVAGTIARKVVCPIPYETAWESVPLSDGRYERIKKLQTDLSLGLSFKAYVRLLSEEVLALVRPDLDLDPFELGNWHDLCDHVRRAAPRDEFRKLKENVTHQMAASPVIYENQALPTAELENVVHKKDSFDLYNNLERMRTEQTLAPTCAYTADICRYLQHSNISLDEIQRLKQLVLQHKYKSIPIHFYHNRLLTQFEFDLLHGGRRGEANDMDDLTRAATALWAAQIYVCDAEMAELCKKAKIREIQAVPTIVFSTRQPDLFLQHLESTLQISSPR